MRIAVRIILLGAGCGLLFSTGNPTWSAVPQEQAESRLQQANPSPTLPMLLSTVVPIVQSSPQGTNVPSPSPTIAASPAASATLLLLPTQALLVPLAPLKLTGRLVYTEHLQAIQQLDMATGLSSTIYRPPARGYVMSAAVAPDNSVIAMAYQLPPVFTPGTALPHFSSTNIYLIPAVGNGQPTLYLKGETDHDVLYSPFWSPDGKYFYYIHFHSDKISYDLERVTYPDTSAQTIVQQILFASLSPDGAKIAYLQLDSGDLSSLRYNLDVADASGANPRQLVSAVTFTTMDVVIFTPDSKSLIISAVGQPQAFGGPVGALTVSNRVNKGLAKAHDLPSDLWQIPVQGSALSRITNLNEVNLSPAFSPDGKHLALLARGGIYVMDADGSNLVKLTNSGSVGSLAWVP